MTDIENNFTYHAPKDDQTARYISIREKGKSFALLINELCPPSRMYIAFYNTSDNARGR